MCMQEASAGEVGDLQAQLRGMQDTLRRAEEDLERAQADRPAPPQMRGLVRKMSVYEAPVHENIDIQLNAFLNLHRRTLLLKMCGSKRSCTSILSARRTSARRYIGGA